MYGVWEGLGPVGRVVPGSDDVVATDALVDRRIAAHLWGGRLPDSFAIVDAEMYACYKYLLKVWTRLRPHRTCVPRAVCMAYAGCLPVPLYPFG